MGAEDLFVKDSTTRVRVRNDEKCVKGGCHVIGANLWGKTATQALKYLKKSAIHVTQLPTKKRTYHPLMSAVTVSPLKPNFFNHLSVILATMFSTPLNPKIIIISIIIIITIDCIWVKT